MDTNQIDRTDIKNIFVAFPLSEQEIKHRRAFGRQENFVVFDRFGFAHEFINRTTAERFCEQEGVGE